MPNQNVELLLTVFGVVFLAELPDKTALAAVVLATRNRPGPVFLGTAAALTVQSAVAVGAGQIVSLLPSRIVHAVAGAAFLVSALVMWLRKPSDDEAGGTSEQRGFWRTAWLVFGVVFIAEWGDLTQIATAGFAAHYAAPVAVFAGATAALWSVAAIAVFVGHRAGKLLSPRLTQRIAAVAFALVGIALILHIL
jgi:putative Ca2+/H+ antiporter (TMEM165/GDT1 family)